MASVSGSSVAADRPLVVVLMVVVLMVEGTAVPVD